MQLAYIFDSSVYLKITKIIQNFDRIKEKLHIFLTRGKTFANLDNIVLVFSRRRGKFVQKMAKNQFRK